MDVQGFTIAIDRLERYYRAVDLSSRQHPMHVTTDLKLVPKLCNIVRCLQRLLLRLGLFTDSFNRTDLSMVLETIRLQSARFPTLSKECLAKKAFVLEVLESIRSNKDPHLTKLRLINRLQHESEIAHHLVDKKPFTEFVAAQRVLYEQGSIDAVDGKAIQDILSELALEDRAARKKDSRKESYYSQLPVDVLKIVFSYLPATTATLSRFVCKAWNIALNDTQVWNAIASRIDQRMLFSAFRSTDNCLALFRENRARLQCLKRASLRSKTQTLETICPTAEAPWQIQRNEEHLILSDLLHFHIKYQGRFVTIPRDIRGTGFMVSEQFYTLQRDQPLNSFILRRWDLTSAQIGEELVFPDVQGSFVRGEVCNEKMYFVTCEAHQYIPSRYVCHIIDLKAKTCVRKNSVESYCYERLVGDKLFVKDGEKSLKVIDLADEATPKQGIEIGKFYRFLTATSDVAFVEVMNDTIEAYSIKTATLIAQYHVGKHCVDAYIHQGMLFVYVEYWLKVFDLLTCKHVYTLPHQVLDANWMIEDGFFHRIRTIRDRASLESFELAPAS